MTVYTCELPGFSGAVSLKDEPLGRGGEGAVFEAVSHGVPSLPPASELVGKIYHAHDKTRGEKLVAMIRRAPEDPSVAWPLALLLQDGKIVGYLMKRLPQESFRMWAEVAHMKQRREAAAGFDVRYALTASLNLALALKSIHAQGHRVGDINESNIFVGRDASVLLVDTDSAQIKGPQGKIFPCLVGKAEYTAAELTRGLLKDNPRTAASDIFGYAVAVYQLLLGGPHPTDAVFKGEGEPPSVVAKVREGAMPALRPARGLQAPLRVAVEGIPSRLRPLFIAALSPSPQERPLLEDFADTLDDILDNLKQCTKVKQHWFDGRDRRCGWCTHSKKGQPDPWNIKPPKPQGEQKKLPPIKFKEAEEGAAPRAPRAPVGGPAPQRTAANPPPRAPTGHSGRGAAGYRTPAEAGYSPKHPRSPLIKGKTQVRYADGTSGPRDSLTTLVQYNTKLAWRCLVNELPDPFLMGWRMEKSIPKPLGLFLGLLLGILVALSTYFFITPWALSYLPPAAFLVPVVRWAPLVTAATATVGVTAKLSMTLLELRRVRRQVGSLKGLKTESPAVTAGRLAASSLVLGLPLALLGVVACLWALLDLVAALARDGRS